MAKVAVSILEEMLRSIKGILPSRLFVEHAKTILE